jgi:ATP-dependent DNA helicase PIF1
MESLTDEQQEVIKTLASGLNVFMTGCGGTGKSHVIKSLPRLLTPLIKERVGHDPVICCTALTGCAALLLGCEASTLHSWAGIGLGKDDVADLVFKIQRNGRAKKHWKQTDVLIIDEISMLTLDLLDKLDDIGKRMRRSDKPFGGIQLLLVGDFCQLPPVMKDCDLQFAFESSRWSTIVQKTIELKEIHRQKDPVFQTVLGEARRGSLSVESIALLKARIGLDWKKQKIRPTLLFPKNAEVDMINTANLKALKGIRPFEAGYAFAKPGLKAKHDLKNESFLRSVAALDKDAMYRPKLELAVGAQVMLIKNLDVAGGLVNGSRGVIVKFGDEGEPIVEFLNGRLVPMVLQEWPIDGYPGISRTQYPLRLAWACTIHKAQGATLDSALIDIGVGVFEVGQAYVALSRVKSLDSLFVHSFSPEAFQLHTKVEAFYKLSEH